MKFEERHFLYLGLWKFCICGGGNFCICGGGNLYLSWWQFVFGSVEVLYLLRWKSCICWGGNLVFVVVEAIWKLSEVLLLSEQFRDILVICCEHSSNIQTMLLLYNKWKKPLTECIEQKLFTKCFEISETWRRAEICIIHRYWSKT